MKLHLLRELYIRNKLPEKDMQEALDIIILLNSQIELDLDVINQDVLDELVKYIVKNDMNSVKNFVILMRYFYVIDRKDLYIHLTKYTGMLDVMENIIKRLEKLKGKEASIKILKGFKPPYLGVHPTVLPEYAKKITELLESALTEEEVEHVLAGNNHSLSKESQIPEKVEYENAKSFADYLRERHERKVNELKRHLQENKVWYEQIITQEVVDFVASNQEVLSGVIRDNKLHITKIPYDTLNYLNAKDNTEKKYYGCHCPFAREAIKSGNTKVPGKFCYCSAGFAKFPFEVILDQKLKIKVTESILLGHDLCKFEIDLDGVNYK